MNGKHRHLPRPRIQRAFVLWFRENRARFKVPVRLTTVTHAGIMLNFPSHTECLCVLLSRGDLSVHVKWQGVAWDMLISLDAWPEPVNGGYRCSLCLGEIEIWPTREAIWIDHLFEAFLSWVNECLATADTLRIFGERGSFTSAELNNHRKPSPDDHCIAEIPLLLKSKS